MVQYDARVRGKAMQVRAGGLHAGRVRWILNHAAFRLVMWCTNDRPAKVPRHAAYMCLGLAEQRFAYVETGIGAKRGG